jgi:sigma-E factor negative regulatory protein RseA
MSEQLKESLSAVIDGEADEFEIRRVLDEATADEALRGVWERYHLVSSVLRGEGRSVGAGDLSRGFWERVDADTDAAAVTDDAEILGSQGDATAGSWTNRLVGVAVAAGVAAAVVVGFGVNQRHAVEPSLGTNSVASVAPYGAADGAADVPVALVEETPVETPPTALDLQRMHAYMLHHARQVALTNQARAVPFVKVAAFESQ